MSSEGHIKVKYRNGSRKQQGREPVVLPYRLHIFPEENAGPLEVEACKVEVGARVGHAQGTDVQGAYGQEHVVEKSVLSEDLGHDLEPHGPEDSGGCYDESQAGIG